MMKVKLRLSRGGRLAAASLAAGLLLTGCIRSILGPAQTFTLLAGKKIVASASYTPSGAIGAAEGLVNVSSGNAAADTVFAALDSLLNTQTRLRALPQKEITPAALLAGGVEPGFYHVAGSLTLPAGANVNLVDDGLYVFNVDGSLNLGANASVTTSGGAQASNVFFNVRRTATLAAGSRLAGILVSEGDITAGAGAVVSGKLLSRSGSIFLNSAQVSDVSSVSTSPALHVPSNVYRVAPGQPVSFSVTADLLGFPGTVGLFVKDLPAGAVQTPNLDGPDTNGPNGSDLLDVENINVLSGAAAQSTFSWTPTVAGTYRVTYLARAESLIGPTSIASAAFTSPIDVCTVTIEVGTPGSSAGVVSGSGVFGTGPFTGTFALAVSSRGGTGSGTLRFSSTNPRIAFQSQTIESVQVYDLGNGAQGATIQGIALISNFGLVPFTATAVDGGRGTEPDLLRVTVLADLRQNGSAATTFGGPVVRRSGEVVIR